MKKQRTCFNLLYLVAAILAMLIPVGQCFAVDGPNPSVNYNVPNYANSPLPAVVGGVVTPGTGMRKFVDSLPGLGAASMNNLGQYIPVATADTASYPANGSTPASDYYEIALVEYREQMHSDLPAVVGGNKTNATGGTTLRGYVQIYPPGTAPGAGAVALTYPGGAPIQVSGQQVYAYDNPHYLGPLILATKNKPVRIKFYNLLPLTANGGDLFIPVDVTVMGAGPFEIDDPNNPGMTIMGSFTENRATLHLHGGNTPWISDGTPHQWTTPAGESTSYPKGVSVQNVPDMPVPSGGAITFYYTNQQSGRLMFYHDHAYGITRLNVYAGEAAGYLLTDPVERALTNGSTSGVPAMAEIPLIIQDKSFVPGSTQLTAADPLWDTARWGGTGNLWFPHVYMPNQWPNNPDNSGSSPMGRWDWGPWFWPVFPAPDPLPALSCVPESFLDTPVINGTAYPYIDVPAGPVRFRILNAANDRYFNLQFYQTTSIVSGIAVTNAGSGYTELPIVTITRGAGDTTGQGATAFAMVDLDPVSPTFGQVTSVTMLTVGSSYTVPPTVTITPGLNDTTGIGATATAALYTGATEVGMVPYNPPQNNWPAGWGMADARDGGVPDPLLRGPAIIQIGTEGGILPKPALIKNIPVNYDYDRRSVTVLNVLEHALFLGPAERADVIVDFTPYAGKTLILYNDSPAPVPAADPRVDYYTAGPDWTANGGAPSTLPGYGPNTRTIMQIRVAGTPGAAPPNDYYNTAVLSALQTALPPAFAATQDRPIVAESVYNSAYGTAFADQYAHIFTGSASQPNFDFIDGNGAAQSFTPLPKAIQELFDTAGRMNSTLGVELPATSALIQTTIPLGYIDPPTEEFTDGQTQVWKITHNGVDTHAIHFHLFNVQVINRVGWDGMIKPPDPNELGWKETVRMNPLEDVIVAMRAKSQTLPFTLPDSVRPLDVTMPIGSTMGFTGVDPTTGNPLVVTNQMTNFGWEYVWHCHLLGHEENDMMRPLVLRVGAATGATVGVAPSSLTFTGQLVGTTSAAQTVTLSNTGTAPLTINSIGITGANSGDFARTTTCGTSLAAGANCSISVTFRPTAVGARSAGLTISSNDSLNPTLTVTLTGTGLATPVVAVSPASLSFSSQAAGTTSAAQTVTLSNTGTASLTINSIGITGANSGDFARTTTCGATLAAGANCSISVTFTPTAAGARTATLTVANAAPATSPTVALSGTGIAPIAGLSPASLTFTTQLVNTNSIGQLLTLSNTGTATLTINSIGLTGANTADFVQTNSCGATLTAGGSCVISITFRPTASGTRSASVSVSTNDLVNPTLTASLTGTGTAVRLNPTALTFANQLVGTRSAAQTVTLSNLGATAMTVGAANITITGANATNFTRTTNCGATLAAGSSCTINVRFGPTASGAMVAALSVATSDPAGTQTVSLTGTGVAPINTVSPLSLTFANQRRNTASVPQQVTVTNTGTASLVINRIAVSGGFFPQFRQTNNCPIGGAGLAAGGSCTTNVTFRPTSAGAKSATLNVNVAAPATSQSVALSGRGL